MNLLKALATVSSMTFVSRVLGFVRDAIIARVFGAGLYTDAFFVAFRIPNLLRRLFAEGAFSQAFVPVLAEYKTRRGDADTRVLVDHVAGLLFAALAVVTILGVVAAPLIVWVSAPGFHASADKFDVTVSLLRVTFPYILFISLTALAGGVLNTYSRFSVPAFTPTLLNVSFIGFALLRGAAFRPADHGARLGGAGGRRAAARIPGAIPAAAAAFAPLLARQAGRRRVAHRAAHGACALRRVDQSDFASDQYHLRVLSREWQRLVAVLRGPADGVSRRHAGRGARHHPAAQSREDPRQRRRCGVLEAARLGACASRCCWRCPRRSRSRFSPCR